MADGSPSRLGWASVVSFGGVVATLTLASRAHELPLAFFTASAAKIGAGEIWLLPAGALVVDRPVYVGLVAFGLIGFVVLGMCGTRVFWVWAVLGHVGRRLRCTRSSERHA